ncbi:MAG: hypothetical protein GX209_01915 [Epulopiscium sp.]|nr:hypothetical protein [Candidatus Epulonipiscium sp.]
MQTFKDLTPKKKLEHVLYYYKWHMIVGVCLLFLAINLIVTIAQRDKNIPLFILSVQGIPKDYDKIEVWEEEVTNKIAEPDTKQKVRVDYYPIRLDSQDQISVANTQKFAVLLAAGDLDVVCLDEELFLTQAAMGFYHPLDELPELSAVLDKIEPRAIRLKTEADTNEHIYGIWADGLEIMKKLDESTEGKIIGIVKTTKRLSYSTDFIQLVLENEGGI